VLGVGGLIIENDRILLVERGNAPLEGYWSLPGGAVETGERLEAALRREIREETGLEVDVLSVVEIFERIMPDAAGCVEYHYVLIDYLCRPSGGTLCAATDARGCEWYSESELAGLKITEGTLAVIEKAFRSSRELMRVTEY